MTCPYCGEPLSWHDYYGVRKGGEHYWLPSYIEKTGDIYKCNNEDCECCGQLFYTDKSGELHEGYPC